MYLKPEHRRKDPPHRLLGMFSPKSRARMRVAGFRRCEHVVVNASETSWDVSHGEHCQAPQRAVLDNLRTDCKCAQDEGVAM